GPPGPLCRTARSTHPTTRSPLSDCPFHTADHPVPSVGPPVPPGGSPRPPWPTARSTRPITPYPLAHPPLPAAERPVPPLRRRLVGPRCARRNPRASVVQGRRGRRPPHRTCGFAGDRVSRPGDGHDCPSSTSYFPLQTGRRFSMKALSPSFASLVCISSSR